MAAECSGGMIKSSTYTSSHLTTETVLTPCYVLFRLSHQEGMYSCQAFRKFKWLIHTLAFFL